MDNDLLVSFNVPSSIDWLIDWLVYWLIDNMILRKYLGQTIAEFFLASKQSPSDLGFATLQ